MNRQGFRIIGGLDSVSTGDINGDDITDLIMADGLYAVYVIFGNESEGRLHCQENILV